jgi:hypothetical protein
MTTVLAGLELTLNFLKPAGVRVVVRLGATGADVRVVQRDAAGRAQLLDVPEVQAAAGQVLELKVPFKVLGVPVREPVAFMVALNRGAHEIEHHPRHRPIELEVPGREFPALNWTA